MDYYYSRRRSYAETVAAPAAVASKRPKVSGPGANLDSERFLCPVCTEVPEKEIYQCQNGHIFCNKCSAKLKQCPQCRVSIEGAGKSRNRTLEELLDDLLMRCPFSEKGCKKQMKRKDVERHRSSCKYGKQISICKLLGYSNCNFALNVGNVKDLLNHLETVHGQICNNADVRFEYVIKTTVENFFGVRNGCFSIPMKFPSPRDKILFVVEIKDKFVSWLFFDMSDNGSSRPQLQIKISSEETPSISWTLPVFSIMEAEERMNHPMTRICVNQLKRLRKYSRVEITNNNYTLKFH